MMPLPAVIHCTSPGPDHAPVAQAVAVVDLAAQHVGDGLDAAVRVPGEPGEVLVGVVGAEVVQQQEGIEPGDRIEAEHPVQPDARPFQGVDARPHHLNFSGRFLDSTS